MSLVSLVSLMSLDAAAGQWRWRGGNRRNVALIRISPARCDIATVAGQASGLVPGGERDGPVRRGTAVSR